MFEDTPHSAEMHGLIRGNEKAEQTLSPWVWEREGISSDLEAPDAEGVPLREFRAKEAREIAELLDTGKRFIFVRANSGYGVSKYLIPELRSTLQEKGEKEVTLQSILSADDLKEEYSDEYKDCILIVDEIVDTDGGVEAGIAIVEQLLQKNLELQVVVIFDDRLHQKVAERFLKLEESGLLPVVELQPKLLNLSQATDFAMYGPPFEKKGAKGTLFEGLTYAQSEEIVKIFSQKYPLHFRMIEGLRWILDYISRYERGFKSLENMSFEDRKKIVEDSKELTDYFEGFLENDYSRSGIKKKK